MALETSRIAQSKADGAWIKKFAQYEVAEQTTIAEILKSMGATPAKMTQKQNAVVAKEKDAKAVAGFNKSYVADQITPGGWSVRTAGTDQKPFLRKQKHMADRGAERIRAKKHNCMGRLTSYR